MSETALITGASSGLGKEFAFQLANEGYDLILTARSENKLSAIKAELETQTTSTVEIIIGDLTIKEDRQKLCDQIMSTPDFVYLVNNAGFGIPKEFLEIPLKRHSDMLKVHVDAVVELSYTALKKFSETKKGTIITVASVAAFVRDGMYGGTKQFQVNFSRKLAEVAKTISDDISIQALCPGYTRTNFHFTEDYEGKDVRKRIPNWLWLDADKVVRESIDKAKKKKLVVIPSLKYKLAAFLGKIGLIS